MEVSGIFHLSEKRVDWLLARQTVIAENIANANSPGYRSKEIMAFNEVVKSASAAMKTTHSSHLASIQNESIIRTKDTSSGNTTVAGNSVNLERELMNMAEVRGKYALSTAVVKAFHKMYLSVVKSS